MYAPWGFGVWGLTGPWGEWSFDYNTVRARPPGIANAQKRPVYVTRTHQQTTTLPRRSGVPNA